MHTELCTGNIEGGFMSHLSRQGEGSHWPGAHTQQFPGLLLFHLAAGFMCWRKHELFLNYFKGIPSLSGYVLCQKHNE